jgi:uncharacterized protein DUF5681
MTKKTNRSASTSSDGRHSGDDYKVGYGKPPKEHQFKPGRSGNPRGRPKGTKSEDTIVRAVINRRVGLTLGGKARNVPLLEAVWTKIADDALKGNAKAQTLITNRARTLDTAEPDSALSPDDEKVLQSYRRQVEADLRDKGKTK